MFIEEQNGLTLKNGLRKIYKNKGIQKWIPFFIIIPEDEPEQIDNFVWPGITEPNIITQLAVRFTGKKILGAKHYSPRKFW